MGHYAGDKFTPIVNIRNNNAYFQILKFHYKVADVMIKPENADSRAPGGGGMVPFSIFVVTGCPVMRVI
jgi:hypothetical protein